MAAGISALLIFCFLHRVTGQFLLTLPKQLDPGTRERLTLTTLGPVTDARAKLTDPDTGRVWAEVSEHPIGTGGRVTLWLDVPPISRDISTARVELSVNNNTQFVARDVRFRHLKVLLFLATDKPIYTPSQLVELRVIALDSRLQLLPENETGSIWISSPKGDRLAQWTDISFSQGVVHVKTPLGPEPDLGRWTATVTVGVDRRVVNFEVLHYVLPKFEVTIETPSPWNIDDEFLNWTICARYTYGRPVSGTVHVKAAVRSYFIGDQKTPELTWMGTLRSDGCKNYSLNVTYLEPDPEQRWAFRDPVEIFTEVTEEGSGVVRNATRELSRRRPDPLGLKIVIPTYVSRHVKPGLPYQGEFLLEGNELPDEVKVCPEVTTELWQHSRWRSETARPACTKLKPQGRTVKFIFGPLPPETTQVAMEFRAPGGISNTLMLYPWYSPSGSFLQLRLANPPSCGSPLTFKVAHASPTSQPVRLYYMAISKGDVMEEGEHILVPGDNSQQEDLPVVDSGLPGDIRTCEITRGWDNMLPEPEARGEGTLTLSSATSELAPRVRLLAFYVRSDGEVVADSAMVDLGICSVSPLRLSFESPTVVPGSPVSLRIGGPAGALCSLGAVDAGVAVLRKEEHLDSQQITQRLLQLDLDANDEPFVMTPDSQYCKANTPQGPEVEGEELTEDVYHRELEMESAGFQDSATAFEEAGIMFLSSAPRLEVRPCRPGGSRVGPGDRPMAVALRRHHTMVGSSGPKPRLRTHFPDTWVWSLIPLDSEGEANVKLQAPDSITSWDARAACVGPQGGLALSGPASLTVFQPFFISLALPVRLVRGETLVLPVTVASYVDGCLTVRVWVELGPAWTLLNDTAHTSTRICGRDTLRFSLRATTLGSANVTVHASTVNDSSEFHDFADSLVRTLEVKPEGVEVQTTTSYFFCLNASANEEFRREVKLTTPDDAVSDSSRVLVSISGDVMGPPLEKLDRLVRLPHGCGEQNLALLVPNLLVLEYLKSTGRLTERVRDQALDNVLKGYRRQQSSYLRKDGSYSIFGDRDPVGSAWLTAFAVQAFSQASRWGVPVNLERLEASKRWLASLQIPETGCFPAVGAVHSRSLKGGVNNTAALTAYILGALLEAGHTDSLQRGLTCLKNLPPDNYTLALTSYLMARADPPSARPLLKNLLERASAEGDLMFWNSSSGSVNVETAGYVVLALCHMGLETEAGPIVRWLSAQRNPWGGFHSTQDTVVGLKALAEYGKLLGAWGPPNLDVEMSGLKTSITEKTGLLTHRHRRPMTSQSDRVDIVASGSGCALAQVSLRYNRREVQDSHGLDLLITQKGDCDLHILHICVTDSLQSQSNMIVAEVYLVSGYVAVADSIELMYNQVDLELKRHEIEDTKVILYFSKLAAGEKKCFLLELKRKFDVQEARAAVVTVYDYYAQERKVTAMYSILQSECLSET